MPGDVLWSNAFDTSGDLAGGEGQGSLVEIDGRTALRIDLANDQNSSLRTYELPVEALRGKWVFLSADLKGSQISPKPLDWNGVKTMLKVENPAGELWPQLSVPAGTFEWNRRSTRILIPPDATAVTLFLGLERVTGTVWFDDLEITLARELHEAPAAPPDQPVFRGHDLPALRGVMAHPRMTPEDLRFLAEEWNGNLIRWQLVRFPDLAIEMELDLYDAWLEGELEYLDWMLTLARQRGVRIVVDLHSPPAGRIGGGGMAGAHGHFWGNAAAQDHFVAVWEKIALRYKGNRTIWGFDLLNEPDDREVTINGEDWQTLSLRAAEAIRAVDPERTLIVEPASGGSAEGFLGFEPLDLPNVVYSFHVYTPFTYTHQNLDGPGPPIPYPGMVDGRMWDKAALEASMAPAIAFAERYRVHMYIGEFSAIRWAPGVEQYLEDLISIFEARRWDWTYHSFREWHGWNLELGAERDDLTPDESPNPRLEAILRRMKWNQRPQTAMSPKVFPADAVVNITAPPYLALPDDGVDDTAAIQQAITDSVDSGRFIYFPAGVYHISDTLVGKNSDGVWRAMVTLQGADRERTILRLNDAAPGFDDRSAPKAMLMTGSLLDPGEPDTGGGGNKAYRNNVMDLTFDTGGGNPGAIGIEWAASNWSTIKDVTIRSGDGSGHAGLSMRRRIPGPGYVKRTTIEGFDYGIDVSDIQYGFTLEHVHLRDQKQAGIRLDRNLLHIRRLTSDNIVPTLVTSHPESVATILDSNIRGTAADADAILAEGNLAAFDLEFEPAARLRVRGNQTDPAFEIETLTDPAALTDDPSPSLHGGPWLGIEDSPEYWNHDLGFWQAVGPRLSGESDDTGAIQRAVDVGKPTVYFPLGRTYFVSDTIVVRGGVRQILGMGSEISLGAAAAPFGDAGNPRALFRIEPTNHAEVTFEHIFFNTQYPGLVLFENASPKTVVIRHSGGWIGSGKYRRSYRNTAQGTGKVFIEDVFMPGWDFAGQDVWARQFNPENQKGEGDVPQVRNRRGNLWILGFKTEGQAPFLVTEDQGASEVLGAYHYISATDLPEVPATAVPYLILDSRAFLSFTTENFRENDYDVYIRAERNGHVRDWTRGQMPPRNGVQGYHSFVVPWFHYSGQTFDAWRRRHFTAAEMADPAISGGLASPAGDGIVNLVKYHLGLEPWEASPGFTPEISFQEDAATLTLTYTRADGAADSVGWLEWSTTLKAGDWQTSGIDAVVAGSPGGSETITASMPTAGRERLFVRLRVVPTW